MLATLREAAWAPLAVFAFYVLGLYGNWFKMLPTLDIPTHFIGGVAITYFYFAAIRTSQPHLGPTPGLIQSLLAFTATGTTTVMWEFYENLADHFLGTHMVRGLEDTIVDLAMGISGALVVSLLYKRR